MRASTISDGLTLPWGMAFLPNGDALVSERDSGQLLRISPSGDKRVVGDIPEGGSGEGGLLGIALAPNFGENRLVYAYYTTAQDNRVVRFRLGDSVLQPVVTGIPAGQTHNGGRIAFGPDGKLYVATGDARTGGLVALRPPPPRSPPPRPPPATGTSPRTRTRSAARSYESTPPAPSPRTTPSPAAASSPWATATSRAWPGTLRAASSPPSSARTPTTRSTA